MLQERRWNQRRLEAVLTLERLQLLLSQFNGRIGLVRPQALRIPGGHDAQTKQNNQNP